MEPDETTLYEHKWLFVIIPVAREKSIEQGTGIRHADTTLFAAYCKHCDTYYTVPLDWSPYSKRESKTGLPRFGCVGIEGRF